MTRDQSGIKNPSFKHGESKTLLHALWKRMIQRCHTPTCNDYYRYGARGISVCDRWRNSFMAFKEDMGPRPPGTSVDRYPNQSGNYEPGNCRWATPKEQMDNAASAVFIEFGGKKLCLNDWDRHNGASLGATSARIKRGMAPEIAVTKPFQKRKMHA